jgi:hypothetical protein
VLCLSALMAAVANSIPVYLAVVGPLMLLSGAATAWFWHPATLAPAYKHMQLVAAGQLPMLAHLACFWLSAAALAIDTSCYVLAGWLVIRATDSISAFVAVQAVSFAAQGVSTVLYAALLGTRRAELHLNAATIGLASMPLYQVAKALLLAFNPGKVAVLCGIAAIDLLWGGRSSVTGLAGFMTLPSREIVAVWQLILVTLGSGATMAVTLASARGGATPQPWLLAAVMMGAEAVRMAVMALMARAYGAENLSAP